MEWFYPRRRGPEWKQGWTGQTLASISSPPPALLTIFGIVIILLWLSQYTGYKAQLHLTTINFQLFLILLPILLIFIIASYSSNWSYIFRVSRTEHGSSMQQGGGIPWGIAILVVVLLVLLSYQSSFHSKWFGAS
ncbi:Transmembrane protein [Melia azedarach]|uniref:Transmembrane protein n=1 Tax=Melia azedarach TaxID=155640 RepID=A0ACC1XZ46_MELAZ|nr:Transmembrane protein [Melia azedarach]